jgi:hypothetical protein
MSIGRDITIITGEKYNKPVLFLTPKGARDVIRHFYLIVKKDDGGFDKAKWFLFINENTLNLLRKLTALFEAKRYSKDAGSVISQLKVMEKLSESNKKVAYLSTFYKSFIINNCTSDTDRFTLMDSIHNKRVAVISSKSNIELYDTYENATILSHRNASKAKLDDFDYLVVDDAFLLRTWTTKRVEAVKEMVKSADIRLIFLTSQNINDSIIDFWPIFRMFNLVGSETKAKFRSIYLSGRELKNPASFKVLTDTFLHTL